MSRGEDDGATRMTEAMPFVVQLFVVELLYVSRGVKLDLTSIFVLVVSPTKLEIGYYKLNYFD